MQACHTNYEVCHSDQRKQKDLRTFRLSYYGILKSNKRHGQQYHFLLPVLSRLHFLFMSGRSCSTCDMPQRSMPKNLSQHLSNSAVDDGINLAQMIWYIQQETFF